MRNTHTTFTWYCDLCGGRAVQQLDLTRFESTDICASCLTRPISFLVEHGTRKAKLEKAGARSAGECAPASC